MLLNLLLPVVVFVAAFLVNGDNADAFAAVSPAGGGAAAVAAAAARHSLERRPSVPRRVLILPDSRAEVSNLELWHHHLKAKILAEQVEASIEDMPDPYSFNTKRYESFWIKFMTDELALCPETLVVAHGTAADAVLRFVENHEVWGAVLVSPGGELYHAGERHGRAYVWPRVRRGCKWLSMVYGMGDPIVGDAETRRVKDALDIPASLFQEVSGGQQRLRDRTGCLSEVEDLVLSALASPTPNSKSSS